ncbi:MAG: flagellar biosynthetic protein FliR [Phycisphaerales bacterium]|nr:flagellar biosynthetic protein FliR [Phycisphaerales bacterium]
MISLGPILWHAAPFVLVLTRLGGLFVLTPLLANRSVPLRARALLAIVLSAALYPTIPAAAQAPPDTSLLMLAPMVAGEFLIGLLIGFTAAIPIMAMDLAGFVVGYQMGLGLARAYNPEADADTDLLGQLLIYVGLGAFLALGGLEAVFSSLARSFAHMPPGHLALTDLPIQSLLAVLTSGFELAIRVSAPALGIIMLLLIAMGFIMKTMPQINVLSVGFSIKIIFGLLMLTAALPAVQQAAATGITSALGGTALRGGEPSAGRMTAAATGIP